MIIGKQHTSVLIVGAGPSGLMMAAQLLRHGVQPIIIDSKRGPTEHSKAIAVQARSLEIYRQLGIVDKALPAGQKATEVLVNYDNKEAASVTLTDLSEDTLFPFVFMYEQSKNERLLLDFLTTNCCPVYWETSLSAVTQTAKGVSVELLSGDEVVTLSADWIIGADGARSIVRKQARIAFNGDTYAHQFFLADVTLHNNEVHKHQVQLCWGKNGMTGFFPLPEPDSYRIIGNLPTELANTEGLSIHDLSAHIKLVTGFKLNTGQTNWFTTYRLHHRMAESFRLQRCFLIGDAAHIHSPIGGQGMNTGLQDAYNLGWKLAGVINKQLDPAILDSYAAERMPVAKMLLNSTDRAFKLIMSGNWLALQFKKYLLPKLLKFGWQHKTISTEFFKRLSQTNIHYRDSKININLTAAKSIKAGDRLPYLKVFDEKKQQHTDLHQWCAKPGFTLIIMGKLQEFDLFTLAKWITQKYAPVLNFFYLPPSAKNMAIFDAFEVRADKKKALIVRPDMHIGLINDVIDIEVMDNYLLNIVGLTQTSQS